MFLLYVTLRNQIYKESRMLPGGRKIKREGRKTEGWWRIVGQRLEVGKKGSSGS